MDSNVVPMLPAEPAEIRELEDEARDWQKQFHILKSRVEARGFKVFYDAAGEPDLVPAPPDTTAA